MIKESVVVKADPGFDGRPIALLVQEASQYASQVYILMGSKPVCKYSVYSGWRKAYQCEKYYGDDESEPDRW